MKTVSKELAAYLNSERTGTSCGLYELVLDNGNTYRYCDTDKDITWNGDVYKHDGPLFSRKQTKTNNSLSVDSMILTVNCDKSDQLESKALLKAAHDGSLDQARMIIRRCFFNGATSIGTVELFTGHVEVKQAGGLKIDITVKSKTQGLNMEFPLRKYYPQGTYSLNSDTNIISSSDTEKTCLIAPFVPQKEVLL